MGTLGVLHYLLVLSCLTTVYCKIFRVYTTCVDLNHVTAEHLVLHITCFRSYFLSLGQPEKFTES
jgi:hypothetical protein